ncbi:MAG TPA: hypothetical protein VGL94_01735, partial [Ktedonobacteraceae bacterium]
IKMMVVAGQWIMGSRDLKCSYSSDECAGRQETKSQEVSQRDVKIAKWLDPLMVRRWSPSRASANVACAHCDADNSCALSIIACFLSLLWKSFILSPLFCNCGGKSPLPIMD